VDETRPLLSWRLASGRRGDAPAAYQVTVSTADRDRPGLQTPDRTVWDSGRVADPAATGVVYAGPELSARTRYRWRVTVWAEDGAESQEESWFETGLMRADAWGACWIAHDPARYEVIDPPEEGNRPLADYGLTACPLLRRVFQATEAPTRARLYVSARGLYELRLSGQRVGDAELTPGWTDYRRRIQYQVYDVTDLVRVGENVLAATLADGWWSGFVGFDPRRAGAHYGDFPQLIAELRLDYVDGRHEVVATDGSWRGHPGPIRHADLLMGECYDARYACDGWDQPGFSDSAWPPVLVLDSDPSLLVASVDEPVRAFEALPPRRITRLDERRHLVDFGQNFAGRVRLTVRDLPAGDRVTLRHGEALDDTGGLYTENLRTATATDTLIGAGNAVDEFEPRFTYHGFRYVEVDGLADLDPADLRGVVMHSDTPWTGAFACADPELNRLHAAIGWGQRSNFVSVPTDCPQRDERLGWLADAQVFAPTACLNADVGPFLTKWLADVRDAQSPEGGFGNVAPPMAGVAGEGAPGWADAGVLVPWQLYRVYGDRRILARSMDSMVAWVDFVHRHNPELIWRHKVGPHFSDWLALGPPVPRDLLATAYFARSADLTSRAAAELGHTGPAQRYAELAANVRAAFQRTFVRADGQIAGDTQTGYLLALAFGLLPPELTRAAGQHLAELVQAAGPAPGTGFLGVSLLAPVLDECGYADLVHALLRRTDPPSWRYPLRHGATTIWERWDGYTDTAGFKAPAMNSFNHYALGSIGEWLYRGLAGLDQAPHSIGYADLLIRPRLGDPDLSWARASYESARGTIAVHWVRTSRGLRLDVQVPPGASATVHLPTVDPGDVRESGEPLDAAPGVRLLGIDPGVLRCRIGSGTYHFTTERNTVPPPVPSTVGAGSPTRRMQ
jgi:alpha-L-rhamnosidase